MLPDADTMALRMATDLFKVRQPLASALVCAELAQGGLDSAELWCVLGSSLMASRGQLVRKPFEAWAAKVFQRGAPGFPGTPWASVAADWLRQMPEAVGAEPVRSDELADMIEFLLVHESVLPDAAQALGEDAAMSMVMILGDRQRPLYVPLLRRALEGRLGAGAARSALKRLGPFLPRPDVQASLQAARDSGEAEELQPYLRFVLEQLPPGWDAPRSAAGPPYHGIGKIDVELISAGDPRACAAVLASQLGASERDANAWAQHVPCVVKRGAMRHDALALEAALQAAGAMVTLHGFTYSDGSSRAAAKVEATKRPWWKFW